MSYTNYGYYGLDNDINALAHYGTKGMRWYAHDPNKLQQSLSKYAHGPNTKGVTAIEKKAIEAHTSVAKVQGRTALNRLKEGKFKEAGGHFRKAIGSGVEAARLGAKAYARAGAEIASKKLAGAAAKVLGVGIEASRRAYHGLKHIKYLLGKAAGKAANKILSSKPVKAIANKAAKFTKAIGDAFDRISGRNSKNSSNETNNKSTRKLTSIREASTSKKQAARNLTGIAQRTASQVTPYGNYGRANNAQANRTKPYTINTNYANDIVKKRVR